MGARKETVLQTLFRFVSLRFDSKNVAVLENKKTSVARSVFGAGKTLSLNHTYG